VQCVERHVTRQGTPDKVFDHEPDLMQSFTKRNNQICPTSHPARRNVTAAKPTLNTSDQNSFTQHQDTECIDYQVNGLCDLVRSCAILCDLVRTAPHFTLERKL
jgi:hypothetical protein